MPRGRDRDRHGVRRSGARDPRRGERRAAVPRSGSRPDLRDRVRLPALHPAGRAAEPGQAFLRHHADGGARRQHPELLRQALGRPLPDRPGRRRDDREQHHRLRRGAADPDRDRRHQRVRARRARGQSGRRGQGHLDPVLVRSAGREAGRRSARRGGRRRHRAAPGHAIAGAGRGRKGRLGDRLRIRHDELRARALSDRHDLELVPVLHQGGRDGEGRQLQARRVLRRPRRWHRLAGAPERRRARRHQGDGRGEAAGPDRRLLRLLDRTAPGQRRAPRWSRPARRSRSPTSTAWAGWSRAWWARSRTGDRARSRSRRPGATASVVAQAGTTRDRPDRGPDQALRRAARQRRGELRDPGRSRAGPGRRERRRQDHGDERAGRPLSAGSRRGQHRRHAASARLAESFGRGRHRHGPPAAQAGRDADGLREPLARAAIAAACCSRARRAPIWAR